MTNHKSNNTPYIVAALLLTAIFALSPNFGRFQSGGPTPFGADFLQEWIGAYLVWNHGPDSLANNTKELQHSAELLGFTWQESNYFPVVYPPFYYILLSPIALLPYKVAAYIFAATMVACLLASGKLMERASGANPWVFFLALLFTPLLTSLTTGQKGTACLLILTATYCLLQNKRPVWAGVTFGLMAFKPHLAIVIGMAMLLKRQYHFAGSAALTALLFATIGLFSGWEVNQSFINVCTGAGDYLQTGGYDLAKSHCLYSALTMLLGGESTTLAKTLTVISIVGAFVLLHLSLRKSVARWSPPRIHGGDRRATINSQSLRKSAPFTTTKEFPLHFSAMVICTMLVSPHLYTYDLTMLLLPMFLMYRTSKRNTVLVIALFVVSGFSPAFAATTGVQLTTLIMLAMLWSLSRQSAFEPSQSWCPSTAAATPAR